MIQKHSKIEKNEEEKDRMKIIHKNFFSYLKERGITQVKYAADNTLDKSTLSRWKNNTGKMSPEQIFQAAEYLGITVNDLCYSFEEKKKIEVLKDKKYDPILAQQQIKVKLLNREFKKPIRVFGRTLFYAIFISVIVFFIVQFSGLWSLLLLSIPLIGSIYFKMDFAQEKIFLINYLDDVYYKIDKRNNQYKKWYYLLLGLSFFLMILFILLFAQFHADNENLTILFACVIIFLIIYGIINLLSILSTNISSFKEKIYDWEIEGYTWSLAKLYFSFCLLSSGISLLVLDFKHTWYFTLLTSIIFIIEIIEFYIVSKKYSEYKLVYSEYEKDERLLFPENFSKK